MHHIKNFVLNHLKKIGLSRGDHILLYSKISSFGFSEKKAHKTILKTIIEFLTKFSASITLLSILVII